MSPLPLENPSDRERFQRPLTLSETWTWPAVLNCPNQPTRRSPVATGLARVRVTEGWRVPGDMTPPCTNVGPVGTGWKTATTAYQSVEAASVALPSWGPAAPAAMSCSYEEPVVAVRAVYVCPWLVPGVTEPDVPPVTMAE